MSLRGGRVGEGRGGLIIVGYTTDMKKLFMILVGVLLFISPLVVLAQGIGSDAVPPPSSQTSGLPPSQTSGAPAPLQQVTNNTIPTGSNGVQNPLGSINSFCGLIKALIGAAIQIGIPIAVLFIVYAGLKFVLARGNSEALISARTNFMWTVIGIAIFLGAWLLAMVIANTVNTVSQGVSGQQSISCQ